MKTKQSLTFVRGERMNGPTKSTCPDLEAINVALVAALTAMFEHCAMTHNRWGDGCNIEQANQAIKDARAALVLNSQLTKE